MDTASHRNPSLSKEGYTYPRLRIGGGIIKLNGDPTNQNWRRGQYSDFPEFLVEEYSLANFISAKASF